MSSNPTKQELNDMDLYYQAVYGVNILKNMKLDKTFKYLELLRKRHIIDEALDHDSQTNLSFKYIEAIHNISNYLTHLKPKQESVRKRLKEQQKTRVGLRIGINEEMSKFQNKSVLNHRKRGSVVNTGLARSKFIIKNMHDYILDKAPKRIQRNDGSI